MKPALPPVFLLGDGAEPTPHSPAEIDALLESASITPECLAAVEGMPAWRSVPEALTWSRASLLAAILPAFEQQLARMLEGRQDSKSARLELREACGRVPFLPSAAELHAMQTVLQANVDLRHGHRHYEAGLTQESRDAFPALELFRGHELEFPRDWPAAWISAGGQLFAGRMIARVDDPVWLRLSDFGCPFPPFSLDGAMSTRSVDREDAVKFGLLGELDDPAPLHFEQPIPTVGIIG